MKGGGEAGGSESQKYGREIKVPLMVRAPREAEAERRDKATG